MYRDQGLFVDDGVALVLAADRAAVGEEMFRRPGDVSAFQPTFRKLALEAQGHRASI